MSFSLHRGIDNFFWVAGMTSLLLVVTGCEAEKDRETKALRKQLVKEMRNHSYESAAPLARRLTQTNPSDDAAWKRLVQAHLHLHDIDGAKQALAEWRKNARTPLPRMEECEGDIAREARDLASALGHWRKAAAGRAKRHRVFEKIAGAEQSLRHWAEAVEAWSNALKSKETATSHIHRAVCYRQLRQWTEAFADLHEAQRRGPDEPEVQRWSRVFENIGRYLEQIKELDAKVAALPTDAGLLGDRALLFLRSGDPEMALTDCDKALELAAWAVRPKLFKGIALISLGRARECERLSIRQPLKLEYLSPDFLETMSRLDSTISVEPKNAEHYATRAWQLNEIGQPGLALIDADTAARLDPRSGGALAEMSYALMKLGRAEEAFAKIKTATQLDPTLASAWQYRGELEMHMGNNMAAIDSLSHALNIQQTVAALQKREECYRRIGLLAQAEEDRKAVQRLTAR